MSTALVLDKAQFKRCECVKLSAASKFTLCYKTWSKMYLLPYALDALCEHMLSFLKKCCFKIRDLFPNMVKETSIDYALG